MLIRRFAGLVGLAVSAWLFWEALHAVIVIVGRGSDLASSLFEPPTTIMRLTATALMMLGGLLAIAAVRGAAWLFSAGALVFALMTGAMAGMGADYSLWSDEAILAPFLLVISGLFIFTHRR